jgi:hypothetical protein
MASFKPRPIEEPMDIWNVKLPLEVLWGIYARQSTPAQLVKNAESTEMQTDDLKAWLASRGVADGQWELFDADLGLSGQLRIDQRTGLQELVEWIKTDKIKAVLVYQISRLFRDQTGVQYNVFADICKQHHCLLVTSDGMVFNFNNPIHLKMYRMLAEMAAEFIPTQIKLLHDARLRKARKGYYAGQGNVASGYIVDYDEDSPTFGKIICYGLHNTRVFWLFERYYELAGNFNVLCREVDEMPYFFPDFEPGVDKRNVNHWKHRVKVPGGYKITRFGVKSILTNPVYLGWWIVGGDVVSRTNHEPIIDKEHEYLFWYAFDRLSDYTTEGEVNEKRTAPSSQEPPRRFYQRCTDVTTCSAGILKDRITAEGAKVYVQNGHGKYNYIIAFSKVQGRATVVGDCQVDAASVDAAFTDRFFTHLEEVHELEEYHRFIEEETQKQAVQTSTLVTQLLEAESQQEAILDEIMAIRREIKQQIYKEQEENVTLDTEKRRQELEHEAQPFLDKLRTRFNMLEVLKKDLQAKLAEQPPESEDVHKARQFASFHTELHNLRLVWEQKPFSIRKEFVNLFVETAVISIIAPHWIKLSIVWSYPTWGVETLYIRRNHGEQTNWTEEEIELVRRLHSTRDMLVILQALPTKTWKAIKRKGLDMGMPARPRTALPLPTDLSWQDIQFMQAQGIAIDQLTKYMSES